MTGAPAGVFTASPPGTAWRRGRVSPALTSPVIDVASAASRSGVAFASAPGQGVLRTHDGGATWHVLPGSPTTAGAIAVSAAGRRVFTSPGSPFIARSLDGGRSWSSAALTTRRVDVHVNAIVIAPSRPQVVVVGAGREPGGANHPDPRLGGVFQSRDGGATWARTSRGLGQAIVFSVAVDPRSERRILAGTDRGVFRTVDGGATWTAASRGLTTAHPRWVPSIAADPVRRGVFYAAATRGVFVTRDGGGRWSRIGDATSPGGVDELVVTPGGDLLLAAVPGRGVAALPLAPG
ncbi:MAG: hypothetical protein AB1416_08155 [Actinomycetota bacterium]